MKKGSQRTESTIQAARKKMSAQPGGEPFSPIRPTAHRPGGLRPVERRAPAAAAPKPKTWLTRGDEGAGFPNMNPTQKALLLEPRSVKTKSLSVT